MSPASYCRIPGWTCWSRLRAAKADGDKAFSKVILQNVEVLAVAQEVEQKKDEPEIVKVVTLLVTPQESERLALASHSGTLRLAMRNYNDNKIVLTSGSDVAQMLRAYSLAPDVPVMAVQPEPRHVAVAPHRSSGRDRDSPQRQIVRVSVVCE